ncbi:MAG: hypothetical protein WCK63_13385 [Betaproteobacteria bacterium]
MSIESKHQLPPSVFALTRGAMLFALTVLYILSEALGPLSLKVWAGVLGAVYLLCVLSQVRWSRRAFVAIGLALSVFAVLSRDDGWALVAQALAAGGFIIGFFIALSSLRTAAGSSASIRHCGEYLASRTPGKRYLALTTGGHLFSLVLNYGSISLLGTLVERAESGPDGKQPNEVRVRRMLLAIQRGFVTSLCWSPLAFSMAVGSSVIVGSSWEGAAGYGLISALLLGLVGWGVDAVFKPPRSANAPPPLPPTGSIRSLAPLLLLLLCMVVAVRAMQMLSGLRLSIAVMAVVPLVSMAWIVIQTATPVSSETRADSLAREVGRRLEVVICELDAYKSEMVLLYMAGYIGKLGGALAAPLITANIFDFSAVPAWVILSGLVCGLPLLGQIGMNPILSVSLVGPLLPSSAVMGVSPDVVLAAVTLGWAFAGATSPFTATVLLVALFGKVSPTTVGLRWNGGFLALGCLVGSLWVLALAMMTG